MLLNTGQNFVLLFTYVSGFRNSFSSSVAFSAAVTDSEVFS